MSQQLYNFSSSELQEQLGVNNEVSLSQELFTPAWFDQVSMGSMANNWPTNLEEVEQTSKSIEANPFPGHFNFRIQIEDTDSKLYTYSKKLNRLYCNMDRAIPITFRWEGSDSFHVRALLMFKEPDHVKNPVFRCRTHNDEQCKTNQGCKHYQHIVRCDNDNTVYKENITSRRHSVVTLLQHNQNSGEGIKGLYRFMCNTTCNGVDAIARRKTDLILTLEDCNSHRVVGRAVVGVKICSCPVRDKKRDEEDCDGRKKRKCEQSRIDPIKKRNTVRYVAELPSPLNGPTSDFVHTQMIKSEVEGEASHYMDLQVSIPKFPCSKLGEFQSALKRLVASCYISDDDINAATEGVRINKA